MILPPLVKDWPVDALEEWLERASILEFCGNRTQEESDREAEGIVRREWESRTAG